MSIGDLKFSEIEQAYDLYKSYEKNKAALKEGRITDLFFVKTGHGLEFIKKYSVKGQWTRFVSWVKEKFGSKDRPFNIETNLSEAGRQFEVIFSKLNTEDVK